MRGKIIKGLGLGKHLGFPTINLDFKKPLPLAFGVYAVKVRIKDRVFLGVAHYGPRLTFNASVSFEVYLLRLNKKVYDEWAEVEIIKKLRDVKKFKSEEELKKQIAEDIKEVKIQNLKVKSASQKSKLLCHCEEADVTSADEAI